MKKSRMYQRFCNLCGDSYKAKRLDSRFCSNSCKQMNYKRKRKSSLGGIIDEVKMDYPKMTFRLSVFGFIASVAFYLGVLRDLSLPKDAKDKKIEQLEEHSKQLENHIILLEKKTK